MLAMGVNDNVGCLDARGALLFIASVLAPTEVAEVAEVTEVEVSPPGVPAP
jgi:hypothetical protein